MFRQIKGISYLVAAINEICKRRTDFVVNIIGQGDDSYKKMVEHLGLDKKIIFCGLKSRREVSRMMRESDFLVLASEVETFSCVTLEAMASGLPVIATNVGAIPEILTKKSGILIPPNNTQALTDAIDFMLDNYSKYLSAKISVNVKKHDYRSIGKKFDTSYRKIITGVGGALKKKAQG